MLWKPHEKHLQLKHNKILSVSANLWGVQDHVFSTLQVAQVYMEYVGDFIKQMLLLFLQRNVLAC